MRVLRDNEGGSGDAETYLRLLSARGMMVVHCDKGNTLPLTERGRITSIMLQRGCQPETMTPHTHNVGLHRPCFFLNVVKCVFTKVFVDVTLQCSKAEPWKF